MKPRVSILVALAAIGLVTGWQEFKFLTDDAFIAFRYVSNSILGHGYVWNPEPFRPVEGYTSFLWVAILDVVWRAFGIKPPQAANVLSLLFSFGTMLLMVLALWRMKLNEQLEKLRFTLIGIALAGLLLNTTFLTWTSSGLETALFNFCITAWIVLVITGSQTGHTWRLAVTGAAAATYLARPDGIVVVLSTILLMGLSYLGDRSKGRFGVRWILSVSPLLIPPVHILWRKSFYGEWLPNTYYAKSIGFWPESGLRYLASFVLEYGIWIWLLVLLVASGKLLQRYLQRSKMPVSDNRHLLSLHGGLPNSRWGTVIAVATLCIQIGYYTIVIGGDHFEWRVYSHLPPLLLISFIAFLDYLRMRRIWATAALLALIASSLPIPWAHHFIEKQVQKLPVADTLHVTVAGKLPFFLWPIAKPDDELQAWLTDHLVCVRRREHELFAERQMRVFPPRTLEVPAHAGRYPVAAFSTVGVAGWVLPNVNIIDAYGLNDYIIARHEGLRSEHRRMAHDRSPPEGYIASFIPNFGQGPHGEPVFRQRRPAYELTANRIKALESYWEKKIIHGVPVPDSAAPFSISKEK